LGELYGEPAHLFKDKLIYKPPGAKGHDLHQDYISWPTFPTSFVTAAVPIDPCRPDHGGTQGFPGGHREGSPAPEGGARRAPADGDYHALADEAMAGVEPVALELAPGDVAFFGGYTPHRSGPNRTDRWRRLLYLSYNADSDGGDQRDAHYREFHDWLKVKYAE